MAMSYTDNNITDRTNRAFFEARKSIEYAMCRGFDIDLLFNRPANIDSPVRKGILDHVHTRVVGPFSQKFELSLKNQYFFRPIKFEFEDNIFANPVYESVIDQLTSVLFPIMAFIDPVQVAIDGCILAALYLANSLLAFCKAIYLFSKETLNGNRDHSEAIENLNETASNFLIALCMPVAGATAAVLDCVRLITRCVSTLINLAQENCTASPTPAGAALAQKQM